MNKEKRLDAEGKGEYIYDYSQDIFTFKIKDRDYKTSFELQNFAIDIDSEDFVTGIRIFDASKITGINKFLLRNIVQAAFNAQIRDKVITVRLNLVGKLRNKIFPIFSKEQNVLQQISTKIDSKQPIQDSQVVMPELRAG